MINKISKTWFVFYTKLRHELKVLDHSFKLDVRIIGDEFRQKNYTGRDYCEEKGIEIYYNSRDHRFFSNELRKQVKSVEENK